MPQRHATPPPIIAPLAPPSIDIALSLLPQAPPIARRATDITPLIRRHYAFAIA